MKYPMANNWLTYHRISRTEYDVLDNLDGTMYTMGCTIARFARNLDGRTNPYEIDLTLSKENINTMLSNLKKHNLLRENRILQSSLGTILYTVWIPRWTIPLQIIALLMNNLLLILWLPTLLFGLYVFINNIIMIDIEFSLVGYLFSLVIGICFHEFAHAFAGISYHAKVFEFGIGFQKFMPFAYTLVESSSCKRLHRIQINAAGVESNFFLTGVFLIFCALFPHCSAFFFTTALCNLILSVINLLFLDGLDGMAILSDVFDTDTYSLLESARSVVHSQNTRKTLREKGFYGHALILTSYIIVISQIGFPLLLLINVGGVIACFV